MAFASKTEVSPAKSRAEIEGLIERYGADQFFSGFDNKSAMIGFTIANRQVRFILTIPDASQDRFRYTKDRHGNIRARAASSAKAAHEQEIRSRWRALALVIKAKLEAVEIGISTFEKEFLANIVMPGGELVGDIIAPRIATTYESGAVTPLLPNYSGDQS